MRSRKTRRKDAVRLMIRAAGALVYIGAFLLGLFSRTAFAALNGWEGYTMDGHDLVCGLLCIVMVWAAKGTFFPLNSPKRRNRSDTGRQHESR